MKRIIRLTESDLARIVKRVMNEEATNMENTTLAPVGSLKIPQRSICMKTDYIPTSVKVQNTGNVDAFITGVFLNGAPVLEGMLGSDLGVSQGENYGVNVDNKASFKKNPDTGKVLPVIPPKKTGVVLFNLSIKGWDIMKNQIKSANAAKYTYDKYAQDVLKPRTANISISYNGLPCLVPVEFGGFTVNASLGCTGLKTIAKGF